MSADAFKPGDAQHWTLARIADLSIQEIRHLLDNAERLREPALAERCRAALRGASGARRRRSANEPG